MLSNDISKKIMLRFQKSKDFKKTMARLSKEGYIITTGIDKFNDKFIKINDNKWTLVTVYYEDNTFKDSIYKQNIKCILY